MLLGCGFDDFDGSAVGGVGKGGDGEPIAGGEVVSHNEDLGVGPDGFDVLFDDFGVVSIDEENMVEAAHGGAGDDKYVLQSDAADGCATGLADAEFGEIGGEAERILDEGDGEKLA